MTQSIQQTLYSYYKLMLCVWHFVTVYNIDASVPFGVYHIILYVNVLKP